MSHVVRPRAPRPVCKICWGVGLITLHIKQEWRSLVRFKHVQQTCPKCQGVGWLDQ